MKKVTGYIYVRALGEYDWEFYVPDDATNDEIKEQVEKICHYAIDYTVEEGYEEYTETCYRKKCDKCKTY